jgi:hypothetical protein
VTTDVAENGANGAVTPGKQYRNRFIESLQKIAEVNAADNADEIDEIALRQLMDAESSEDILATDLGEMLNGEDLIDVEQQINGFKLLPSNNDEFDNGYGVWALITSTALSGDHAGEDIVWNTGAKDIIRKLRMHEVRGLPLPACVIRGQAASKGTLLLLRAIPKRVTAGSTAQ